MIRSMVEDGEQRSTENTWIFDIVQGCTKSLRLPPPTKEKRLLSWLVYELAGGWLLRNRPVAGGCSISPLVFLLSFFILLVCTTKKKRTRPA